MAISGVNFGASMAQPKSRENKNGLAIKTVAQMTALPVVVGSGYAARFYYENKGKASVYKDMIAKFPADDSFKSCLNLVEKSQKNAKLIGGSIVVAGVAAVIAYAGAKALGLFNRPQLTEPSSPKDAKAESKVEVRPEEKLEAKPIAEQKAKDAKEK